MPNSKPPPKAERNESIDRLTTGREFLVAVKRLSVAADSADIETTLWNRS